jgi:hypothetical protein
MPGVVEIVVLIEMMQQAESSHAAGWRDSRHDQGPAAPSLSGHLSTHQTAPQTTSRELLALPTLVAILLPLPDPPILTMSAVQKIAVHSLSGKQAYHTTSFPSFTNQTILEDLKNTTDDALPNYLHSLKFKQIHTQTDVRLAIGYVAVAIAGALFFFDWKFGWDASRPYTAPAVAAYFILNGAFSYWLWFVEKGVVYEGEGKTGKVCVYPSTAYIMGKQ